jgi:hypothetical protein
MARDTSTLLEAAQTAFEAQSRELDSTRDRQLRAVVTQFASGTGDIGETFGLDRKFRLVFIRCHFSGGSGTAAFRLSVDAVAGAAFDTRLFTISQAGVNKDVNLRIGGGDAVDPSPWTFRADDSLRIEWMNPDSGTMNWGLEVGLALAS